MTKEQKIQVIADIKAQLAETPNFYIVDIAGLDAEKSADLRRACFEAGIKLSVVKNTLFAHVLKESENDEIKAILPILEGPSAIMYTVSPNSPAKLIKKLQKAGAEKPALKGAYVQECAFVGSQTLDALCNIKSKEELIGQIVASLQAPAANVISALQSAGSTVAGVLKTLEEKGE
ncbi:MAG: 50S ribosomal protein L10 [Bacteroidales bacterium]|nr:50S ribosomal protein L10 [Bacteroidales bacterium]